ncbi:MAG: hypothetical protein ABIC95_02315 [archaeon]
MTAGPKKTKKWAIGLVLFLTLMTSAAQILWKFGADRLELSVEGLLLNVPLIAGIAVYGIAAVLLIIALRGGELSVLYPLIATSYIWVSLLSIFIIGEQMGLLKWSGIGVIVIGVSLIGAGAN